MTPPLQKPKKRSAWPNENFYAANNLWAQPRQLLELELRAFIEVEYSTGRSIILGASL